MGELIKATWWGLFGQFAKLLVKFGVSIFLARLLSPHEFGLVGMVTVLVTLLTALSELGLVTSIIQKKEIDQEELSSVFWVNAILGLLVGAIFFFSAGLVADFYKEPELVNIVRLLSVNFVLNSTILTHNALMSRSLRFKQYELYTTISTIAASGGAITLALNGYGVWALAGLYSLTVAVNVILVWSFEKWRPSFVLNLSRVMNMLSFGIKISLSVVINTIFSALDSVVIGKYFASSAIGLYSFSQNLINIPTITFSGVFSRTLLPTMSKAQEDPESLRRTYKKAINIVNICFIPAMLTVAILADVIVETLLNEKWIGTVPYLRLFAILAIVYPLSAININILVARGKAGEFLKLEVVKKLLLVTAIFVGLMWGIIGILYGMIIASAIGVYFNMLLSGRNSNYTVAEQLSDLVVVACLSLGYGAVLWFFYHLFTPMMGNLPAAIVAGAISAGLLVIGAIKFIPGIVRDLRNTIGL